MLSLLLVTCLLLPLSAHSETRYITDEQTVTVRKGTGNEFKIVKMLTTGAKVDEISRQTDWAQIRTDDGNEGWILSRFLSKEPPARLRIDAAHAAQKKAEEERDRIKEENSQLQNRLTAFDKVKAELDHLSRIAADPVALDKVNQELKKQIAQQEEEISRLQRENQQLSSQANTYYFLAGAGVLFFGFLGGLVMSRPRRRSYQTL